MPDEPATGAPGDDVLDALAAAVDALAGVPARVDAFLVRAAAIHEARARGVPYAELLGTVDRPPAAALVGDVVDRLTHARGRLRRAQVRALYDEGLSMDRISRLVGVSRQRVSVLIRDNGRSPAVPETAETAAPAADALPHLVWVAAPDGATVYVDEPAAGHECGWVALVHPDDRERARDGWAEAVRTGAAFLLECRLRRADGSYRRHELRGRPLTGAGGTVVTWIGTAVDVDEGPADRPA